MEKANKRQKNKRDVGKIATRMVAAILAVLMVLAVASSLIYYLIGM